MTGYAEIAARLAEDGHATVPEGWVQGRTAYGGLTAALCVEAARMAVPDLPPLRTASVSFIGPSAGTLNFQTQTLRAGRNLTSLHTDALLEGKPVVSATMYFGGPRDSHLDVGFPAPDGSGPEDCAPLMPPQAASFAPKFFHNFDTRLVAGSRPMTGGEGMVRCWSRHVDAASRDGETAFVALADVLPPAAFPAMTQLGPISSVNWLLTLLAEPVTEEGWWLVETRQTAAHGGTSSQVMRYWNSSGDLVAEGMQAVALFT